MRLSIIIVNYNVKYFLEQCLCSVEKALLSAGLALEMPDPHLHAGTQSAASGSSRPGVREQVNTGARSAEIFVVDNHSSDGSREWLPGHFPRVQFILNDDNKGFAVANNQALAGAKGEYILFLNPDTILPEDSLSTCLAFMVSNPRAGAAGLRMIDGSGRFLKESRRGFPTPWVAFCKMAGLTALFPRSPLFAKYYLGHLPATETHPASILPGAFMFVRRQALDQTGGFDERFFLYAEDIDLSYRIEQAGYTNYYIPSSTLLHFKGESTPKDARYIKFFYKAMSQFRRKHSRGGALFNLLLEPAIWLRAGMQAITNGFRGANDRHQGSLGHSGPPPPLRTWVCGDPSDTARLRDLLPARHRIAASGPGSADEIIFCEGAGLSFKEIIGSMESGLLKKEAVCPEAVHKIHGAGTAAAVGSASKDQRGETLVL
jgi:N-acetylglucosaminyl-diphospho-decaprenol L-rhamnosyltransferase